MSCCVWTRRCYCRADVVVVVVVMVPKERQAREQLTHQDTPLFSVLKVQCVRTDHLLSSYDKTESSLSPLTRANFSQR